MHNNPAFRGALAGALLALAACGGSDLSSLDHFKGGIDVTALDARFQPSTDKTVCKAVGTPCYAAQLASVQGKTFHFYNLGSVSTSPSTGAPFFPLAASSAPQVYNFPGNCTPGSATYDPRLDAFPTNIQYPIFSTLPYAAASGNVLPLVSLTKVTISGNTCNDLKSADSLKAGVDNAQLGTSSVLQIWAPIDGTANLTTQTGVAPAPGTTNPLVHNAWYRGLMLTYLDGGPVPVDASGNVVFMDGVILNGTSFAKVTDPGVILLPAAPGDPAYSPVVRLLQYQLKSCGAGSPSTCKPEKASDFTGICQIGATCQPKQVRIADTTPSFNTIFIVASAQ